MSPLSSPYARDAPRHEIQFSVSEADWLSMKELLPHRGQIAILMSNAFHRIAQYKLHHDLTYDSTTNITLLNLLERLAVPSTVREGHHTDD